MRWSSLQKERLLLISMNNGRISTRVMDFPFVFLVTGVFMMMVSFCLRISGLLMFGSVLKLYCLSFLNLLCDSALRDEGGVSRFWFDLDIDEVHVLKDAL